MKNHSGSWYAGLALSRRNQLSLLVSLAPAIIVTSGNIVLI